MKNMIDIAKQYAIGCHSRTNHLYDSKPYETHLHMVHDTAVKFIHLVPDNEQESVLAGCWVHDVIEDCRQTYNDVKEATNIRIAELAYALTNENGRNRKERANDKYYAGIVHIPYATFIKICDRISNYKYSKDNGSNMAKKYEKENSEFIAALNDAKYQAMFDYLQYLMDSE